MKNPRWKEFQDYIAERLKEIDPNARSTKGSGNCGELGDVNNKYFVIECKLHFFRIDHEELDFFWI